MRQIGILEGRAFSPEAISQLERLGRVSIYDGQVLAEFLAEIEILFIRLAYRVDAPFLAMARQLRILVSPTTGHTHIDLESLRARGIGLVSLKCEENFLRTVTATPEHALGLIVALLRNYAAAFLRPGRDAWDRDAVRGHDIRGRRIGIIGFGRVGQWLARALGALGARVSYHDRQDLPSAPDVARYDSPAALIAVSDVVVLSASHENGAAPIIDAPLIDAMAGKYFVNIARGELVDEAHLLRRIAEGHFAGVALDVLQNETAKTNRLPEFVNLTPTQNLILTPHIGGATYEASEQTELHMVARLRELLAAAA